MNKDEVNSPVKWLLDSVTDQNTLRSIAFKREISTCTVSWTRIAQMVELQARDLEIWGSNPGRGLDFSLEKSKNDF